MTFRELEERRISLSRVEDRRWLGRELGMTGEDITELAWLDGRDPTDAEMERAGKS